MTCQDDGHDVISVDQRGQVAGVDLGGVGVILEELGGVCRVCRDVGLQDSPGSAFVTQPFNSSYDLALSGVGRHHFDSGESNSTSHKLLAHPAGLQSIGQEAIREALWLGYRGMGLQSRGGGRGGGMNYASSCNFAVIDMYSSHQQIQPTVVRLSGDLPHPECVCKWNNLGPTC